MATNKQIEDWARAIGLPACIGYEFVAQYGRLPANIPELENWGRQTGRARADGWHCLGMPSPSPAPSPAPSPMPGPGQPVPGTPGAGGFLDDAINWVTQNPLPAAMIVVLFAYMSGGGRRR